MLVDVLLAPLTSTFGTPCVPTISPQMASGSMARPQHDTSIQNKSSSRSQSSASLQTVSGETSIMPSGFLMNKLRKFKNPSVSSSPTANTPATSSQTSPSLKPVSHTNSVISLSSSSSFVPADSAAHARKQSIVSSSSSIPSVASSAANQADCEFDEIPLLRVNFAIDTYSRDPPQQIPARKPKPGNVKFDEETGQIVRPHHTTMDSSNPNAYAHAASVAKSTAYNTAVLVANSVRSDARRSARMATISKFTGRGNPKSESKASTEAAAAEEEQLTKSQNSFAAATAGNIDGSVNKRTEFPQTKEEEQIQANDSDDSSSDKDHTVNLAELYTRCCHLREILPIQATLRQLQNQHAPLTLIRLMNPRPTMIEVLSFADFLAVAPITTLVLDNVDLSEEMFEQLILALRNADSLFRLSMQNVNLTPANWKLLSCFLAHNRWLAMLDISLKAPEPGKKKIKYKKTEEFARENLDWDLFCRAIAKRGGLNELNVNSICFPHQIFKNLMDVVLLGTKRLGVSSCNLQNEDLDLISKWISAPNSTCERLDLAGNTSVGKNLAFVENLFANGHLVHLSLKACGLEDPVAFGKIITKTVNQVTFRFLDLSSNALLFPHISPILFSAMPKMNGLGSLYLDDDNLNSQDVLLLADAIPKCPKLGHVSLVGSTDINHAAAEALAVSIKLSSTVSLVNVDSGVLPPSISRRLTHYCMQNMESLMGVALESGLSPEPQPTSSSDTKSEADKDKDYNFEGEEEIFDDGKELIKAVKYVVSKNKETNTRARSASKSGSADAEAIQHLNACNLSADGLAQRAKRVREKIQIKMHELTTMYKLRDMPDAIRDKLVRFWYLKITLDDVIQTYEIASGKIKASDVTPSHHPHHQMPTSGIYPSEHVSVSGRSGEAKVRKHGSKKNGRANSVLVASPGNYFESDNDDSSTETEDTCSTSTAHNDSAQHDGPLLYREHSPQDTKDTKPIASGSDPEFDDSTPVPVVAHKIIGGDGTLGLAGEESGRHFVGTSGYILDDGHDVMQDNYGMCVLPRRPSTTSLQAKRQAREEGEVHRLGLVMRHKVFSKENRDYYLKNDVDDDLTDREDGNVNGGEDNISLSESVENEQGEGENEDEMIEHPNLTANPPSKYVQFVAAKSGEELRQLLLSDLYHHGSQDGSGSENNDQGKNQKFEELLGNVKAMSPEEFEQYFLVLNAQAKAEAEKRRIEETEQVEKEELEEQQEEKERLNEYSMNQSSQQHHHEAENEVEPNQVR